MKSSEQSQTKAEQREEAGKMEKVKADMKVYLKQQSKNELIRHIFEQLDLYYQQRNLNAQLLEELKETKLKLEEATKETT